MIERWASDPSMPHVLPTKNIIARVATSIEAVRRDVLLAPLVPDYFHFDLVSHSVNMFTEGLMAAVTRFLAISDPKVCGPGTFELFKVTRAAIDDSRKVAAAAPSKYAEPIKEHDVSALFFPFLDSYLTRAGPKLKEWTTRSVSIDPLRPISARVEHSSSIVDVFSSIDQALDFIVKLQWPISEDPADKSGRYALLRRMVWDLSQVTALYARSLEARALEVMERASDGTEKLVGKLHKYRRSNASMDKAVSWDACPVPPEALCAVNDMHVARSRIVMMVDMVESTNKEAGGLDLDVSDALRATKESMTTVLSRALELIEPVLEVYLLAAGGLHKSHKDSRTDYRNDVTEKRAHGLFRKHDSAAVRAYLENTPVDERLSPMIDVMNIVLADVFQALYKDAFVRFMRLLWQSIVSCVEDVAKPAHGSYNLTPIQCSTYSSAICILASFLQSDGAGLRKQTTHKDIARLAVVLAEIAQGS